MLQPTPAYHVLVLASLLSLISKMKRVMYVDIDFSGTIFTNLYYVWLKKKKTKKKTCIL